MHDAPAIDARWLASRLRGRGDAVDFDAVECELLGRFSTEVWRLRLVGGAADAAPRLILKRPYQSPRTGEPPELELAFYERLAETLPVPTPGFVGTLGDCLIVTELPGLRPFDFRSGPTPEHAGLAMEALAALHASRWNRTDDLDWVPDLGDPSLRRAWQADFDLGWRSHRARFHELCPAFTPIGDALVGGLSEALEPLAAPRALLHGDAHAENLPMSEAGGVVFLDWQSPRLGSPGFDTAVFTTMSLPVAARRRVEEALVERHLQSMRARGIEWKDPWADYRLGVLRRAARIVEISARQTFSSLPWVFERCATAAADHRVLDRGA